MLEARVSYKGICEISAKSAPSLIHPLGGGVEPSIRAPFEVVDMDKLKFESGKWKVFTVIAVRVMLNLFQHLTGLMYLLQASKILKQVQDDNEGVNIGVNIFHYYSSVKGGYKTFATDLGMFASMLQVRQNTEDAISLLGTAEGGLGEIQSLLERLRELTIQASNGTYDSRTRESMQEEADAIIMLRNTV